MAAPIEDCSAAIVVPEMMKAPMLRGGHTVEKGGRPLRYVGGFCVVFPYEAGGRRYAVRLWHTGVDSARDNLGRILPALVKSRLPYFVPCTYVKDALMTACGPQDAVVMPWLEAKPLKRYMGERLGNPGALEKLADSFLEMVKDLHRAGFSHGDLQHGNILVRPDGGLYLVDYDSMFVPGMEEVQDDIKGLAGYQHPLRSKQRFRSGVSDHFSELVIYASIKTLARHPGLWERYRMADSETMLFTDADFRSMDESPVFGIIEADRVLRPLGRAVRDALRETSLERILPLEDVVQGQRESIVGRLSARWNMGKIEFSPMQSNIDIFNQLAEISSRW